MKAKKIEIAPSVPRKRNPPRTAFKTANEHSFRPGESGNPSGGRRKDEHRLVSKALKVQLNNRAPDKVAQAMQLPRGASWAQCLAASLIRRSVAGDMSAASLVVQTIEGTRSQLELISESERPREVTIVFEDSDGDGRPRRLPTTIDGTLAAEALEPRQIAAP